ncbi:MAG: tetratricopeptide repeat protein [Bacteroidia bacterium]|nr:tetratricopeptide repeat protein [Bacteroidia bacterium]
MRIILLVILSGIAFCSQAKSLSAISTNADTAKVNTIIRKSLSLYQEGQFALSRTTLAPALKMDGTNTDALMLMAKLELQAHNYKAMVDNLNKIFKKDKNRPQVYAEFYFYNDEVEGFNDSMKRVLCNMSIKAGPERCEGYIGLAYISFAESDYATAAKYFEQGLKKEFATPEDKFQTQLIYAFTLRKNDNKALSYDNLNYILLNQPRNDFYYSNLSVLVKWKLEDENGSVLSEIDTLISYYGEDVTNKIYKAKAYFLLNRFDESCVIMKEVVLQDESDYEDIDLTTYCTDIKTSVPSAPGTKYTYDVDGTSFEIKIKANGEGPRDFSWMMSNGSSGNTYITTQANESATVQSNYFSNGASDTLKDMTTVWLSYSNFSDIDINYETYLSTSPGNEKAFYFDKLVYLPITRNGAEQLIQCKKIISDEGEEIWYLNEPLNPLIVKMVLSEFTVVLKTVE